MIRRLFTAASVLSLILCIASGAEWARSYRRWDTFSHDFMSAAEYARADTYTAFYSCNGNLAFIRESSYARSSDPSPKDAGWQWEASPPKDVSLRGLTDFYFWANDHPNKVEGHLPHWVLMTMFCVLPAVWCIRYCRARQNRSGHCRACGYDLRASTDRCPECGTPIPATS